MFFQSEVIQPCAHEFRAKVSKMIAECPRFQTLKVASQSFNEKRILWQKSEQQCENCNRTATYISLSPKKIVKCPRNRRKQKKSWSLSYGRTFNLLSSSKLANSAISIKSIYFLPAVVNLEQNVTCNSCITSNPYPHNHFCFYSFRKATLFSFHDVCTTLCNQMVASEIRE